MNGFILLILLSGINYHAIYISVIEVDLNPTNTAIQVKIFYDDLEDALKNQFDQPFDLSEPEKCRNHLMQIEDYLKKHFKIINNKQPIDYSLVGCDKFEDSIWLELQASTVKAPGEITIYADYLMELFPTQSNVVGISYQGKKRFMRLSKSSPTQSLRFDR